MHASIPAFAWPAFDLEHALPQSECSPRPVTAGVRHPTSSQASSRSSSCGVAQPEEHPPVKRAVAGSNPAATATLAPPDWTGGGSTLPAAPCVPGTTTPPPRGAQEGGTSLGLAPASSADSKPARRTP
jgi:hypothetical protein